MSDEIDDANARADLMLEASIRAASKPLAAGKPGDCDLCGEWSGRLVGGACAPCRDKRHLP